MFFVSYLFLEMWIVFPYIIGEAGSKVVFINVHFNSMLLNSDAMGYTRYDNCNIGIIQK
jgi:hypothetical protein